jgi:methylated-DNA-[protein]-cysteine S-methyltransferase
VGRRTLNGVPNGSEGSAGTTPPGEWAWALYEAPVGPLLLAASDRGLMQVAFHATGRVTRRALERLRARTGAEPCAPDGARLADGTGLAGRGPGEPGCRACAAHLLTAERELDAYFAGHLRRFTVPLDWSMTGGFHEQVLRELATGVPYGTTTGYQDLAERVGEPGAARAVGVAMGANPLPVVVPCHRVVESGGGLGGFGGGLETKRELLALEGVLPQPLF